MKNAAVPRLGRGLVLLPLMVLAACSSLHESKDFERHRWSQIEVPYDRKDVIFFDVTISPQFPADDPAAEASRMEWLDQWMEQRSLCPAGHEVINKRPFDFQEDNPARHDLRYEVKCVSGGEQSAQS